MTESPYETINREIIPRAIRLFQDKQKDYPDTAFTFLGSRGQFSDITRKYFKLKKAVWDGERLDFEQPEEIVMDLIGHCYLMLYSLAMEAGQGRLELIQDQNKPQIR